MCSAREVLLGTQKEVKEKGRKALNTQSNSDLLWYPWPAHFNEDRRDAQRNSESGVNSLRWAVISRPDHDHAPPSSADTIVGEGAAATGEEEPAEHLTSFSFCELTAFMVCVLQPVRNCLLRTAWGTPLCLCKKAYVSHGNYSTFKEAIILPKKVCFQLVCANIVP